MKQYTFVLNFGYVESASLSYLPFSSTNKYRDAKEALIDLALFLKEQFLLKHGFEYKKCCLITKEKDSEAAFCSACGKSLAEEEFNDEHFTEWLTDMSCTNLDLFHGEFIDYDESLRWQSNGLEGAPNQRFVYQAEWVLAAAIGYPQRDDQTFEDICKDRTKAKRESFSYYD
jgi:hypothetical protein